MDESIKCECGCVKFWIFVTFSRCPKCHTEFKTIDSEIWLRRFDKETNSYSENWEKLPCPTCNGTQRIPIKYGSKTCPDCFDSEDEPEYEPKKGGE